MIVDPENNDTADRPSQDPIVAEDLSRMPGDHFPKDAPPDLPPPTPPDYGDGSCGGFTPADGVKETKDETLP